jgi:hypothetical protein
LPAAFVIAIAKKSPTVNFFQKHIYLCGEKKSFLFCFNIFVEAPGAAPSTAENPPPSNSKICVEFVLSGGKYSQSHLNRLAAY